MVSATIHWTESHTDHYARRHSESAAPPPRRVVVADDRTSAATAHRLACEGTALLWRGDFPHARRLLTAMGRRVDRKPRRPGDSPAETFHLHRRARGHRARVLGRLLVLLEDDYTLRLRRAPDVRRACAEGYGPPHGPLVVSLTELLGVVGAWQWREKGVEVPALGARIHPHYGVFSPVRGEYVDLVARAPLPPAAHGGTAFDLGTGTGVLAALLARRGVGRVVATDVNSRALACARDKRPPARPGRAGAGHRAVPVSGGPGEPRRLQPALDPRPPVLRPEAGVYDPGSGMLRGFLAELTDRLEPGGEGWLILSDLAERLGLRPPGALARLVASSGLRVAGRLDTRPRHPRAGDTTDPLHAARRAEVTSLWRLTPG